MTRAVTIARVADDSPAARVGLRAGDRLLKINGSPVRDVLELYFRETEAALSLEIETAAGDRRTLDVSKDEDDTLGLELEPTPDLSCKEKCVFCFVHQNPRGLRKSLYFKDDDYRLSFLHGNFVTLTHAPEGALERIIEQRLSPLYVSVHATEPALRGRLLGNRGPAPILPILERLAAADLTFYGQIVVCPEWNDGQVLSQTVEELAAFHPACPAVAVVPLGLTEHRERLPNMRAFGPDDARDALRRLEEAAARTRARLGTSFAFAADEIYLTAGEPLPTEAFYEGFPLVEDGVGMWRRFVDGWEPGSPIDPGLRVAVVTGRLFEPTLRRCLNGVSGVRVVEATNRLFGRDITVAGLLSGRCIVEALQGVDCDVAVLPGDMFSRDDGITLDDMTPDDLEQALGFPVRGEARTAEELTAVLVSLQQGSTQ